MAIDDFGTGYSSLAYPAPLPDFGIEVRAHVRGRMAGSQSDHQIVHSIIDLAHNFGLKVVAEGAQDMQTVNGLKALRCDLVQGYVYANPMAARSLVPWLKAFQEDAG